MHRVGSSGNTSNSTRARKEKRLTYVVNDSDDTKHCAGVNCLAVLKSSPSDSCNYLFTGSRDGTLKRWALTDDEASCSATFESHVDWVNDAVLAGNTLVSCSSDTTVKTWNCLSDGTCTRTFRQHSDYVICLAAAEKNSNIVASGGLGGEVFIWDIEAALLPVTESVDTAEDDSSNGIISSGSSGLPLTSLRPVNSGNNISMHNNQQHCYTPLAAKGHKDSVYALALNDSGTILVSGGTEKLPSQELQLSAYWIAQHGRVYRDAAEKKDRLSIFKSNMELIESFNARNHKFKLGANQFADLTNDEFRGVSSRFHPSLMTTVEATKGFMYENVTKVPSTVDWRIKGAVTPVKQQGHCGSPKLVVLQMDMAIYT